MTEKPIIFSGEMVNAILAGKKSQTRRVFKPRCECGNICEPQEMSATTPEGWQTIGNSGRWWCAVCTDGEQNCPYGVPGNRLWVRETFAVHDIGSERHIVYRADSGTDGDGAPWKPSIFMPRWASRITLEVVSVRVERLQAISEADAKAEGVTGWRGVCRPEFHMLWDKINEKRGFSWDSNPYVWAIEFKRVTP